MDFLGSFFVFFSSITFIAMLDLTFGVARPCHCFWGISVGLSGWQLVISKLFLATHSSILAWRIPGMGEPGGLPSMGSHRVRHNRIDLAAATAASSSFLLYLLVHHLLGIRQWSGGGSIDWLVSSQLLPFHGENQEEYLPLLPRHKLRVFPLRGLSSSERS